MLGYKKSVYIYIKNFPAFAFVRLGLNIPNFVLDEFKKRVKGLRLWNWEISNINVSLYLYIQTKRHSFKDGVSLTDAS